jgi:hypothetical protein
LLARIFLPLDAGHALVTAGAADGAPAEPEAPSDGDTVLRLMLAEPGITVRALAIAAGWR